MLQAGATIAIAATISGPRMKKSSCSQASSAYAVSRSPGPSSRLGQSARMHAPTGGIVAPDSAESAARTSTGAPCVAASTSATSAAG